MGQIRESHKRRVVSYVLCVSGASGAAFVFFLGHWGPPRFAEAAFFCVLYAATDRFSVEGRVRGIPRAGLKPRRPRLSTSFLILMAAAFATDPITVAAVAVMTRLVPGQWRGWLRGTFNGAQEALFSGAASATFLLVGDSLGRTTTGLLVSAASGTVAAVVLNLLLVAGVLALERGRTLVDVLREMAWPTLANLPFGLIALLVAILYQRGGPAAAILILAPLFVLREARQGKVELDAAHDRTLRAFVRAVELKDPYTSRHSERVATITVALHRELGAREDVLERRYYGALLHDIGKVAVSGRILRKPERLTLDEIEVVERHPGTGAFVISGVSFLRDVVPEILHHHERLDGRGYPSGLVGGDIPFEARVLAVADTFEALTSDRPYRSGLTDDAALAEIRRSSGSQLDPTPVEALTRLLEAGHEFPILPKRGLEATDPATYPVAREA